MCLHIFSEKKNHENILGQKLGQVPTPRLSFVLFHTMQNKKRMRPISEKWQHCVQHTDIPMQNTKKHEEPRFIHKNAKSRDRVES